MINQVNQNNLNNVYASVSSTRSPYAITKPITKEQERESLIEKERKNNAFGFGVAISAMALGLGVLAASKGFSGKIRHKVNGLFRKLETKTSKANTDDDKSPFKTSYYTILKGLKALTKYSKSLFNTAPLKDAIVMHYIEKSPKLKRISDKITKVFEKISIQTSRRAYKTTHNKFDKMYADFDALKSKLPKEEADKIEKLLKETRETFYQGFGAHAQNARLAEAKKNMDGIGQQVYNSTYKDIKRYVTHKKNYQTYISEELATNAKLKLTNSVNETREKLTISGIDHYNATRKTMSSIYNVLDPSDEESRRIMDDLRKNLDSYKKAVKKGADAEKAFPDSNISNSLTELQNYFDKSSKYDMSTKNLINENIANINKTLTSGKKGQIQEIMDIYRKHLPESEYQNLNASVGKLQKSLHKSIDLETDKLFDKVRDLLIGSAPTDVISVITSLGMVGWGLSKADNKDERISAALKYGIPAVGGVTISLLCTVGLVAAGPSLIIGMLSGMVINKIGVLADDARKKYKKEPPQLQFTLPDANKVLEKIKEKAIEPNIKAN